MNEGDRLGIIGVNGAGKTSLFRLMTGEYTPSSGSLFLAKGKSIGYLEQNASIDEKYAKETLLTYMLSGFPELLQAEKAIAQLENDLALAQNTEEQTLLALRLEEQHTRFISNGGLHFRARSRSTLLRMGFSETDLDRQISSLSGGQHTRLSLSRLLCRDVDILLLDEPTNHLDVDALLWLEDFLSSYHKTVIVISHDRYFLDEVTTKTLKIEHKNAKIYQGNYSSAKLQMLTDDASQDKRYREQQKEIAKIQANIAFQKRCNQAHNYVTVRAKQKQLDRMDKVEKVKQAPKDIRFSFKSEDSTAQEVVRLRNLAFSYGEKAIIKNLSFLIKKEERVLFLGANGCGKSTLMQLITGKLQPKSGEVFLAYGLKVGYYDQANAVFHESYTVLEELASAYPQATNGELRSALALFLFSSEDVEKIVSSLSGGERARLTLCKLMMQKVSLLILDEPTNHLDIGSREALESALDSFDGTVLSVSHDRYFIDRVASRLIALDTTFLDGCQTFTPYSDESPYASYLRHRLSSPQAVEKKESASTAKEDYQEKKKELALKRQKEKQIAQAKERQTLLEKEIEDCKKALFGEDATDYQKAVAWQEKLDSAEEELLAIYELLLSEED